MDETGDEGREACTRKCALPREVPVVVERDNRHDRRTGEGGDKVKSGIDDQTYGRKPTEYNKPGI